MRRGASFWFKRLLLMLIATGLTLVGAEFVVRATGLASRPQVFDRRVEEDGRLYARVPSRSDDDRDAIEVRYALHPAHFPVEKPEQTLRLFVFGGSTVFGMPYTLAAGGRDLSFVSYLREDLQRRYPNCRLEIINCGVIGMTLEGVADIAAETLDFAPDAWVILSGHNEFLPHALVGSRARAANPLAPAPWSWTYRSHLAWSLHWFVASQCEREDPTLGTLDWPVVEHAIAPKHHRPSDYDEILEHAQTVYSWLANTADDHGIELFVATCPSNLVDFEPSSSSLRDNISDTETDEWTSLIQRGREQGTRGEHEDALASFDAALRIDEDGAEAHFRRGRCLTELGRNEEAFEAYREARDRDGVVRRVLTAINDIIIDTGRREGVTLCEVEVAFRKQSKRGAPGNELLVDHVHPNLDGSILIAQTVAGRILDVFASRLGAESPIAKEDEHRADILKSLGYEPKLLLRVDMQIGLNYAHLILLRHYDARARYGVAVTHLQRVLDTVPESLRAQFPLYAQACSYLGGIHVVGGFPDEARACFEEAARYDPNWSAVLSEYLQASSVLARLFEQAGITLDQ